MTTVSQAVATVVIEERAVTFGLMGNGNAYFLDGINRGGGRFVAVRHEVASIAAADTAYRVNGNLAVATVTYGAGFTNMLTSLAEAAKARTPLVVIVGDAPTAGARPWDVDQAALARAIGLETLTVTVTSARATTQAAFEKARRERAPVILAIPYDLITVPAHEEAAPAIEHVKTAHAIDEDVYPVVVDALSRAERPLILAGQGARHSVNQLHELADRIDALTATTAPAKGTFAGRDTDLGVCGGFAAVPNAEAIAEADVVLVVGAALNQFTRAFGHAFGTQANIIQVDILREATDASVTHFLRGDATDVVTRLLNDLPEKRRPEWLLRARAAVGHRHASEFAPDGLLDPRSLTVALNELIPAERLVVQDGGHFSGWAPMYFDMPGPGRFHMVGTAFQTIGLGLGAATGAAVADPTVTTILIAGDGGFLMSVADLETLVRASTSTLVVIYNDAAYGAEVHQYGSRGVTESPMVIGDVNFAKMAEAVGGWGRTVHTIDDLDVLSAWVEAGASGLLLLDCRISPTIVAPYMHEIVNVASEAEARNAANLA